MRPMIPLLLPIFLAACSNPHTQCVSRAKTELRSVDREIIEIETTLARGYRVDERSRAKVGFRLCTSGEPVHLCLGADGPISERRVAIDPHAERARLRTLRAERPRIAAAAERAEATCPSR